LNAARGARVGDGGRRHLGLIFGRGIATSQMQCHRLRANLRRPDHRVEIFDSLELEVREHLAHPIVGQPQARQLFGQ